MDFNKNLFFVLTRFYYIFPLVFCMVGILSFIWHKKEFFCVKFYLFAFYLFALFCVFDSLFLPELPKSKGFYVDEYNLYTFYVFESIVMFLSLLGLFGIYKNKKSLLYFTYIFIVLLVVLNGIYFSN